MRGLSGYLGGMNDDALSGEDPHVPHELAAWRLTSAAAPSHAPPDDAEGDARGIISLREFSVDDLRGPRRRKVLLPALLFLATCLSTFWAGATHWQPYEHLGNIASAQAAVMAHWPQGMLYMAAVIGILLMHEMGHFIQAVRYGVPASLPFFIPLPILMTGTMGAVIGMEGSKADRKQLFDIGLSGPLAGLVVAVPVVWLGIVNASVMMGPDKGFLYHDPLIFKLLTEYLRPELQPGQVLVKNPLLMAGWVGMLITGLNMLPVSQLDGGHVLYGLFGRRAYLVARGFLIAAIAFILITEQYGWTVMLVLVTMLGVDHPRTRDDNVRLGPMRQAIGLLSLAIPIFCFIPFILP